MLTPVLIYIVSSAAILALLCLMILRIGALMATCPENGPGAWTAALSITTGYAAIGAGGIMLIGTLLPILRDAPYLGLLAALGVAALCLGLGFTQAMATLRSVMHQPGAQPKQANLPSAAVA